MPATLDNHKKRRIQVNLDADALDDAERIFKEMGLSNSSAFNMFIKKVQATNNLPFNPGLTKRQIASNKLAKAIKTLPVDRSNS